MSIECENDLTGLTRVGQVVRRALEEMERQVRAGLTTAELEAVGAEVLRKHGARSAPQHHYGFPGTIIISINDEAVHGIPGKRRLRAGDLVKLDVTAELDGYIADAAVTVGVAPVSVLKQDLCRSTEAAFWKAMETVTAGRPVRDIGRAVEGEARRRGFRVIRELSGHGVGRAIHEEPTVPNYYEPRLRDRLTEGLVLTVEPILCTGAGRVTLAADGWTIRTTDGSPSAHYEHTLVVTKEKPILLTT